MKNWNISQVQVEKHSNELKKMILEYVSKNALDLDYNTIEYHISLLEKNNLILHESKKYGATYRLTSFLEYDIEAFNEIILELHKKCKDNAEVTLTNKTRRLC